MKFVCQIGKGGKLASASNAWANVKTLLNAPDEIELDAKDAPKIAPPVKRRNEPSL